MANITNIPRQQLPFSKKNKEWRKSHLEWAKSRLYDANSPIRLSFQQKKINYDLLNNKLNMEDLARVLNPSKIDASFIPDDIQHYPIMNSKINVLRGEDLSRPFPFKVIVTNPNAISQIEQAKKDELYKGLEDIIMTANMSEEDTQKAVEELQYHFIYEWQDLREMRSSYLLNHYFKEYNMPLMFNEGLMDAFTVGEQLYQCDIHGGEPVVTKLNPNKTHVLMSGYSSKIEDADMVILLDYWSKGKIIDVYHDIFTEKEVKELENLTNTGTTGDLLGEGETSTMVPIGNDDNSFLQDIVNVGTNAELLNTNPYDSYGNFRVLRIYWKSRRKIKKVKSYHPETGDVEYTFHTEYYVLDKSLGEEEEIYWINEAWEATEIGDGICVNMRPRLVQYNRISNPSRCHFGIIGSVYNLNEGRPFSLVDHMKPFSYLYDVVHDRLNAAIGANWGKIIKMDLAMIPKGWEVEKWLYYAKVHHVAVVDGFKEGNAGAARGKLAGYMNNSSMGVIDAETGNYIQQHLYMLEAIKQEMSEVAGISKQREGQISNRETVGGVERATLQSSYITKYYEAMQDDVRTRVLNCFIETAKIAMKGSNMKFQYILPDNTLQIVEIDGDDFADADYGVLVDSSPQTQQLTSSLMDLARAGIQNQSMTASSIIQVLSSPSLAEVRRLIERGERDMQERQMQMQDSQNKALQEAANTEAATKEAELAIKSMELELKDTMNERDNQTRLMIANFESQDMDNDGVVSTSLKREELLEKIRQFNATLSFNKEKLNKEIEVKKIVANKPVNTSR